MPKKRPLDDEDRQKLARGLQVHGASERAVHSLWNIFCDDKRVGRGTFTDVVQEEFKPWQDVTTQVPFECHDGSQQEICLVMLRPYLEKMFLESDALRNALQKTASGTGYLTPLFYADEATAGNVLSADKSRKACLFYISWVEAWHLLKHEAMWFPAACVQTHCLQNLRGGVSAIVLAMLKHYVTDEFFEGIALSENFTFRQRKKTYIVGDLDALRQVYSLKGSSGLRCCISCKNVLKLNSGCVNHDRYFVEISSASGFDPNSDTEIWNICDRFSSCRTKTELHQLEKVSGIIYEPASLMFDPVERQKLPVSNIINDIMHVYLCNGIASWEVALVMEQIAEHTPLSRELLKETVVAAGWLGSRSSVKSRPSYLPNLFHERLFGDGLFKGQGHQTATIVPLLQYYVQTVIQDSGRLPPEIILSFKYLSMCLEFLRKISYSLDKLTLNEKKHVDNLQRLHMQAFTKAYAMQVKPKHHVRSHIPEQFLKIGFALSCEVLESRHRQYKSGVGEHQRSTISNYALFSRSVLVRLLHHNFLLLQKSGLPFWELMPPIQEASVEEKLTVAALNLQTSERALAVLGNPSVLCSPVFGC